MSAPALEKLLDNNPVIPVVEIDDVARATDLAQALVEGGVTVIEITMRTEAALPATEAIAKAVSGISVGVGTALNGDNYRQAVEAGAHFIVSPGATDDLLNAAAKGSVPLLPGAVTPGEIMALRQAGYRLLKFFPAEAYGGVKTLSALAGPLRDIRFCPTGGINAAKSSAYLELSNVVCVGGSWIAPRHLIDSADWATITELARTARL